jgi:hypothetical protein
MLWSISYEQSGFIKGNDTQKQLLHIVHMIQSDRMLNKETRGIFLDVEGAFDAIPHYLLLHKLKSYGLSNSLINFLKSYLDSRKLRVKVNGSVSDWSAPGTINQSINLKGIYSAKLHLE